MLSSPGPCSPAAPPQWSLVCRDSPPPPRNRSTCAICSLSLQVVDRVMAHAGGDGWWATLGARARAQTLYLQRHELVRRAGG